MKNALSWILILFLTVSLLNNCLNNTVNKEIRQKTDFIANLRKLYSSGDFSQWPKPILDPESVPTFSEIGHLPDVELPGDNQYSDEKAMLGKTLFFDPRLSRSNQIACASCHDPELAWCDNRTVSFGHDRQAGTRNAMSILNVAYAKSLFWDGRAKSLEEQSQIPIQDEKEMGEHIDIAAGKIAKIKGYEILFEKAFGDKTVTKDRISKAIATFERTIKSLPSKFDQFIDGKSELYTDDEVMGLHLFRTKAQCMNCHNSGYFSNSSFENIGTSLLGEKGEDLGRYSVTKNPEDAGKFRVPGLREISKTGPFLHNGSMTTLTEVIQFYSKGNPEHGQKRSTVHEGITLASEKSGMVRMLELTDEEISQLEAFLRTLSGKSEKITVPEFPK
ncbi:MULTISPECIES: cytochrome-c peroxidase [Chryseobacterium]|uniref:Cytochrome c peroxidase n=1 Tax=Chryseobacterium geocarposphaerae TaxID=1416776 RepID=A0ABU1L8T0_9FLAO|nr:MULTISPECIES: cytochrome c peroxidase [Chryseobacterium]MDR6403120.1 cytochrome c peroxidase [Chryseobacterium geocarposphaerae]MDR6696675.1 cytochrome c peroxidase [Chryseobacterium ginsenosidimutans]